MMPTVSRWTTDHVPAKILKRLALFASGLAAIAACYLVVMWMARDWIFGNLLKKAFQQRDLLLLVGYRERWSGRTYSLERLHVRTSAAIAR
jgi:hypothetical protein